MKASIMPRRSKAFSLASRASFTSLRTRSISSDLKSIRTFSARRQALHRNTLSRSERIETAYGPPPRNIDCRRPTTAVGSVESTATVRHDAQIRAPARPEHGEHERPAHNPCHHSLQRHHLVQPPTRPVHDYHVQKVGVTTQVDTS